MRMLSMDVWSYEAGQNKKCKNLIKGGGNENEGNRNESPGKEVEVVWACDEKRERGGSTTYEGG